VACHSQLQWVQLGYFGTDEIASYVWQVDKIGSSRGQRVAHCRGATVYEVFDPGRLRKLVEMSCGGLEWTRRSVHPQLGTISKRGHRFSCSVCVDTESFG
jgi:hypothetical protein